MNIWKRIRQMSISQLWKLTLLFLSKPLLAYPTYKATRSSMKTCNRLFGDRHHGRGQTNAFRHALWNYEICRNSQKRLKNSKKSVKWTEKVTNLYEKVTQNENLDREMDYQNNAIGRSIFIQYGVKNESFIHDLVMKMAKNGQKVTNIEEIEANRDKLVYLTEDLCLETS